MVAGDEGQSSVQLSAAHSDNNVTSSDSAIWTPYIKGLVEDQEVSVFLDTGAGLSLISEALRQRIPALKHRPLLKSFQVAHTLTGQQLDILGSLPVILRLGSHTWVKTHGASIDTASGTFMFNNEKTNNKIPSQFLKCIAFFVVMCSCSHRSQSPTPLTEIVVPSSVACTSETRKSASWFSRYSRNECDI